MISYGDDYYRKRRPEFLEIASNTSWFDSIQIYSPLDLDDDFTAEFKDILDQNRGGGYWIWKSHIIKQRLAEINDGDILIYLDIGCHINAHGKKRFDEYIQMLNEPEEDRAIISFEMRFKEKVWTTHQIFDYFGLDNNGSIANSGQFVGGIRIMKKNEKLVKLINLESKALYDDALLFTDDYNNKDQAAYFRENRHDQSVFSVIRKMNNPLILEDETFFKSKSGFESANALKYPFWATRKKGPNMYDDLFGF